jgi:hypothetical protein
VVFLLLFAVYAVTAPRTVALEDDGLFIMASHFLGLPQPPGYPLHTLLGKLFTLVPIGPVAYRVHLLSALFGALTGAVVWLVIRLIVRETAACYVGALALGLSAVFWSQATIAEVYHSAGRVPGARGALRAMAEDRAWPGVVVARGLAGGVVHARRPRLLRHSPGS